MQIKTLVNKAHLKMYSSYSLIQANNNRVSCFCAFDWWRNDNEFCT